MNKKGQEILKSIYDSIDEGKFSLAIKQCSRKEVCRDDIVKVYILNNNNIRL